MTKTISILAAILLFSACGNISEKRERKPKKIPVMHEVLDYEIKDILKQDTTCDADILHCSHVRLAYPEFTGSHSALPNKLTHDLITYLLYEDDFGTSRSADLNKVADDFLLDYYRFKKSFPDANSVWFCRIEASPLYEKDSLLCFSFAAQKEQGGAHGMSGKYFITMNRYTGKKVNPLDFVKDKAAFKALVEKKFRKVKNIPANEDLRKAGFKFDKGRFKLPANIGLDVMGFVIRYNVYEIAPYSMGPTEFLIPYSDAGVKL